MIKFKVTFDKDLEQDWINGLCQQGWAFVSFFAGICTFVPCKPGEYIYQIDLLPGYGLRAEDPAGYMEFMEETGVEVLQRWGRWVYLRKRAEEGPFEIYTDADSMIDMYRRIRKMFLWFLGLELCCSASIWGQLSYGSGITFYRVVAAIYVLLFLAVFRAMWRCSQRIQALEQQKK